MFDIGFSELMVVGAVALVVIGPERLPKVARTVGHLLGRMQRYVHDVKTDINREMQLDELKKLQTQVAESARTLESSVREEMDAARSTFSGIGQDAQSALDELKATAEQPASPLADSLPLQIPDAVSEPISPAEASHPPSTPRKFDQTTPIA